MNIIISHTFHPGEYTCKISKLMERGFSRYGHEANSVRYPFDLTCWGRALEGKHIFEVDFYADSVGGFMDYLDSDLILNMHTADERVLNHRNLKAEDLRFGLSDQKLQKSGGVPFWVFEYSKKPLIFTIEIPQVYRTASERFLSTINKRIKDGRLSFEENDFPTSDLPARFKFVCDRKATLEKYPPEIIADKIVKGIAEKKFLV